MTRGRPGRKPANRLRKSFLIEKGVTGTQLKRELSLGGRVNVNDLEGGVWLNPTVVLRRLTVTIGGFKIELLPGPSYTQNVDPNQSACLDDGFSYGGEVGFTVLPDDAVSVQNPTAANVEVMDANQKSAAAEATVGLGPYVNPNDVQTTNGTSITGTEETKLGNQSLPEKQKPVSKGNDGIKQPQSKENDTATVCNKTDGKEKQQNASKLMPKSKQGPSSLKNKDLVSCKTSSAIKDHKVTQNTPSKVIPRGELHKTKPGKEKQDVAPLKRPAENIQSEHATKIQKTQGTGDTKVKPKLPSSPSAVGKKVPSSGSRTDDQQGPAKCSTPHNSSKSETPPLQSHVANSLKTPEEGGQEKSKMKKLEKILQRQKSKNVRSISVEEPQLFIPDNAPVVKKDTADEQVANSETAWDGNNCCGLCKKHHNNM